MTSYVRHHSIPAAVLVIASVMLVLVLPSTGIGQPRTTPVSEASAVRGEQTVMTPNARHDIPRTISYQGVLRGANGASVTDGEYAITARLYSDADGKSLVWQGTYRVTVENGVFNLTLGTGAYPLPSLHAMDAPMWISIQVGESAEAQPLAPLSASPYSLNVADSSITSKKISTDYVKSISVNGQKLTGQGRDVSIVTGDGILASVDPATNSIILKSDALNASNMKGAAPQGNTTVTGTLTVTQSTYLNTQSGQTYLGTNSGSNPGILNLYQGYGSHMAILEPPDSLTSNPVIKLPRDSGKLLTESRSLTAGAGLTGGGDLSADRTLSLDLGHANTWTAVQTFPEDSAQGNNLMAVLNTSPSTRITRQGNTFNEPGLLVRLDGSGNLVLDDSLVLMTCCHQHKDSVRIPSGSGTLVLNGQNTWLGDQTLPQDSLQANNLIDVLNHSTRRVNRPILDYAALDAMNVTTQGNAFNGPGDLVQLDDSGGLSLPGSMNVVGTYKIGGVTVLEDVGTLTLGIDHSVNLGLYNTWLGDHTGHSNTSGSMNTFVGEDAGYSNIDGDNNLFIGYNAGVLNTSGGGNMFSGSFAGQENSTGSLNTFSGVNAGQLNSTGTGNTFTGWDAGYASLTGDYNTFSGEGAGWSNASGSDNTVLGHRADVGVNNLTNATAIGSHALVNQDNSLVLGSIFQVNQSGTSTKVGIGTTTPAQALDVEGSAGSGLYGNIQFSHALMPNGLPGANGEILTSTGADNPPVWLDFCTLLTAAIAGGYCTGLTGLVGNDWHLNGNAPTNPGIDFLGTTNNTAFEIHVNHAGSASGGNQRVMRYEPNGTSANIIGGFNGNNVGANVYGATISGGGANGNVNIVADNFGTIGGGWHNQAGNSGGNTSYATVGGGNQNTAWTGGSTVAGGEINAANGSDATVGGGEHNTAGGFISTIAGGNGSVTNGAYSSVGGGFKHVASGYGSAVAGGANNTASGEFTAIPGGQGLTLSGAGSFGFLGGNSNQDYWNPYGNHNMSVSAANTTVLGNTDLWLANNDAVARALYFFAPNPTPAGPFPGTTKFTGFVAGAQTASVIYTLPLADATFAGEVLSSNGAGSLSWQDPCTLLANCLSGFGLTPGSGCSTNLFTNLNGITTTGTAPGCWNTGHGNNALSMGVNLTGRDNTGIGANAAMNNTDGNWNTAIGTNAMPYNQSGGNNTAVGWSSLFNNTSGGNSALGAHSLENNTSGDHNTAVGIGALLGTTTGSSNSALGAGANVGSGALSNATAIGANAVVCSSNSLVLGSISGQNGALSSTNVGIGTCSPQQALDVAASPGNYGNVQFSGALMPNGQPGANGEVLTSAGPNSAPIWLNLCQSVESCLANSSLLPCPGTQSGDLLEWDGTKWCVSPTMTNKAGALVDQNGTGVNPNLGHAARMMWIPSLAAFRAGDINAGDDGNSWGNSGTDWDDPNIGYGSAAFGQGTKASGNHSFAAGYSVFATGVHGIAFGANGTTASGNNTIALGSGVYASADNGVAMGCGSYAQGLYSTAMGNNSFASGMHATSIGDWARAQGQTSIAAGEQVTAAGNYSLATGSGIKVGDYSFGFNGWTGFLTTDISAFARTAYFGNVGLWIGNTDGTARALRFYAPNTSLTYTGASTRYTSFVASASQVNANIQYTLPTAQATSNGQVLTNDGTGTLSWQQANSASGVPIVPAAVGDLVVVAGGNAVGNDAFGTVNFSCSAYGAGTLTVTYGTAYTGANPVVVLTPANDQAAFSTNGLEKYWVESLPGKFVIHMFIGASFGSVAGATFNYVVMH
ncbi:MAG: hypothetical protein Q8922_10685 [Bacteroidota bacterium]|nr:hypothetical protein [Bacteroidota bacterium]MDP4233012.1 hypothetical protein [Bacteroidota bacterium]MDP4241843.1 hypothetical protein [Bacteroidota bacterium]MDP4288392.1 hypothetical protein [Bacteroidota bacterium]